MRPWSRPWRQTRRRRRDLTHTPRRPKRNQKRAAEKAERIARREAKREARRGQPVEDASNIVPEGVVSEVKSAPYAERNSRRAAKAIPDEVLEAVEQATGSGGRRGSRRIVVIEGGGERSFQANGW
jgi:hypothetical protein